jgi:hypothetical protein
VVSLNSISYCCIIRLKHASTFQGVVTHLIVWPSYLPVADIQRSDWLGTAVALTSLQVNPAEVIFRVGVIKGDC